MNLRNDSLNADATEQTIHLELVKNLSTLPIRLLSLLVTSALEQVISHPSAQVTKKGSMSMEGVARSVKVPRTERRIVQKSLKLKRRNGRQDRKEARSYSAQVMEPGWGRMKTISWWTVGRI